MSTKEKFSTHRSDGTEISPLVDPSHVPEYVSHLGFPGAMPYTRGIQPTMYRGRLWTMRQYAGFGTALETNERFRKLLAAGQTGLSVAFDLPTQMGYDSDHAMAQGEVGRVGVAISTLEDMETLFQEIPLAQVSTSMTINATAAILLCFYLAVAKKQGAAFASLRGTLQNDVLKEYIARGTYIYEPSPSLRLVTDLIAYCADEVPKWNPISISGYHIREAGSDAVQEIAFTLANAKTYARALMDRGLPFDRFAGQLSFFFAAHNDVVEEIAKFRAARRLWARLAETEFRAKTERSKLLRFHVQTAGSTLTAQQPDNNLVRVTLQAMAAIWGGCQSLHTNARDEALSLPTETSAMLALRTQQILAEETGIAQTIDPWAGSYAVEHETSRLEKAAEKLLKEIDGMGGSVLAIQNGFFQKAIADRAYQTQQDIERGQRRVVGVNIHQTRQGESPASLRVDPALEKQQRHRVQAFRKGRDAHRVEKHLKIVKSVASGSENLIPPLLDAVEARATLGEISDALREVFGTFRPQKSQI